MQKSSSNSLAGSAIFPLLLGDGQETFAFHFHAGGSRGRHKRTASCRCITIGKTAPHLLTPPIRFPANETYTLLAGSLTHENPTLNVSMMKTSPRETISLFPPSINYRETSLSKLVSLARIKKRAKGRVFRCERGAPVALVRLANSKTVQNRDKITLHLFL